MGKAGFISSTVFLSLHDELRTTRPEESREKAQGSVATTGPFHAGPVAAHQSSLKCCRQTVDTQIKLAEYLRNLVEHEQSVKGSSRFGSQYHRILLLCKCR